MTLYAPCRSHVSRWLPAALVAAVAGGCATVADNPANLAEQAAALEVQLRERTLPFWHDRSIEPRRPGYIISYDGLAGPMEAVHRHIVSQARLVWTFARAHRAGFDERDYLAAAWHGFESLESDFKDPIHGGYHYTVAYDNAVTDATKYLYTQSFVIYAYTELALASARPEPREAAMTLFDLVMRHLEDAEAPGWFEVAERHWAVPEPDADPQGGVAEPDYKSANSHLHWMEALTELYRLTGDARVAEALSESIELNERYFFPVDPDNAVYYVRTDLTPSPRADHAGLSYGHNVEAAWLIAEARRAIGLPVDWEHYGALVEHALREAIVTDGDGAYLLTEGDAELGPLRDISVWWSQAELIAALSYAIDDGRHESQAPLLAKVVRWYLDDQMSDKYGLPFSEVARDGTPADPRIAWDWKAAYHDVRARLIFIDTFDTNQHELPRVDAR